MCYSLQDKKDEISLLSPVRVDGSTEKQKFKGENQLCLI